MQTRPSTKLSTINSLSAMHARLSEEKKHVTKSISHHTPLKRLQSTAQNKVKKPGTSILEHRIQAKISQYNNSLLRLEVQSVNKVLDRLKQGRVEIERTCQQLQQQIGVEETQKSVTS